MMYLTVGTPGRLFPGRCTRRGPRRSRSSPPRARLFLCCTPSRAAHGADGVEAISNGFRLQAARSTTRVSAPVDVGILGSLFLGISYLRLDSAVPSERET